VDRRPRRSAAAAGPPRQILVGLLVAAVVAAMWVYFAPMPMGGSTTYAVTSGISMEPMLHKNDVALVRSSSSYRVGDVVLYQSQVVNRPVLHRIILIEGDRYFFQGDNNDFIDPGYATGADLVGTYWFKVSKAGAILGWFGTPAHAALLAGIGTMVVAVAGFSTSATSRRRRRRGSTSMALPPPHEIAASGESREGPEVASTSRAEVAPRSRPKEYSRRPAPYFDRPIPSLAALGTTVLLAFVLLIMGFSRPTERMGVLPNAFTHGGTFGYSAVVKVPTFVYPLGTVSTGDPIYPSLVDTLKVRFDYQFTSALPHNVAGTVELRALVLSTSDAWQEVSTVAPLETFTGDSASLAADFTLAGLYTLIDSVIADTGIAGTNYSVDIQPVVHLTGTVGDQAIDQTFSPVLPFAVSRTAIRVDAPTAPLPSGATSTAASAGSALQAVLHPTGSGVVAQQVANVLSIAKYKVRVSALRVLGVIFMVLSVGLAVLHDRLRRRLARGSEEESIAKQLNALIVPVTSLGAADGHTLISVPDFASLAGLARFLERPILYEVRDGDRTFAVDDDALRYVTQAVDRRRARAPSNEGAAPTGAVPVGPSGTHLDETAKAGDTKALRKQVANSLPGQGPSTRAIVARGGAGAFVLALAATATIGFTASTTVPASNVGANYEAASVQQLAPPGCSALVLTTLVTGKGEFSTNQSHALILGSSGADKITSKGQQNCIVGGAGEDEVRAKNGDVCIVGPTTGADYNKCTENITTTTTTAPPSTTTVTTSVPPTSTTSAPSTTTSTTSTPATTTTVAPAPSATNWISSGSRESSSWRSDASVTVMGTDHKPLTGVSAGVQIAIVQEYRNWDSSVAERSWSTQGTLVGGVFTLANTGLSIGASGDQAIVAMRYTVTGVVYYYPTNPAIRWDGGTPTTRVAAP
jgi:signal peptidase I